MQIVPPGTKVLGAQSVTGVIERGKVTELAALPFVRRVELSRALFAEG